MIRSPPGLRRIQQGDKEVDCLLRSNAVVKNECNYTSPPAIHLHGMHRNRFSFYFWVDADDVRTTDRNEAMTNCSQAPNYT